MGNDALSWKVIGAAIEVQETLGGPGLRERVYEEALCQELRMRGLSVIRQVPVPLTYKGMQMRHPLILDLLVASSLIVEVKATEVPSPLHRTQLLTYLRLTGLTTGLVINFGQQRIKEGLARVTNRFPLCCVA